MSHEDHIRAFISRVDKSLIGLPSWNRQPRDGELVGLYGISGGGHIFMRDKYQYPT